MSPLEWLPPHLRTGPFTVGDALNAGVTPRRLRNPDLDRPFYGVRVPPSAVTGAAEVRRSGSQSVELELVIDRCRTYLPAMKPGQFFSHVTAARLWGCPLPTPMSPAEPLHVTGPHASGAPRRAGIAGHRIAPELARITWRFGLPVSDAPNTWVSLANSLPLDELVVAGDHLILDPVVLDPYDLRPHTSIDELAAAVTSSHARGVRLAASALLLIRQGSESRPETLLRLMLVRGGLPEPEINVEIRDASGKFLGRGDLVYPRWRTVVEYDGDRHRTDAFQYNKDIGRIERINEEGWSTVRVRKAALFGAPDDVLARVTRALRRGGWPG